MLDDLYQEVIIDHGKNPRNFGELEQYTCTHDASNPLCGDQVTIYIDVDDDIIKNVSFRARGCAISIASASIMSQIIKGKTVGEVQSLFEYFHKLCTGEEIDRPVYESEDIERLKVMSGVSKFPSRVKCATMSWHAMKECIDDKKDSSSGV